VEPAPSEQKEDPEEDLRQCSSGWIIDISWLDWTYKSSTCDVMYRRQRRHLLWWNLEILFGPLYRSSPFIGELRCRAIQMEHCLI
jgi:hypothetical protein